MDTNQYSPELKLLVQPNMELKVFYEKGNINNETRHIRAIVDDSQVVYRVWSRRRKAWRYFVDSLFAFKLLMDNGFLSEA